MKQVTPLVAGLILAVALPASSAAQQWSREQQEVWSFIERCTQAFLAGNMVDGHACVHEDLTGFAPGDDHLRGKRYGQAFDAVFSQYLRPEAYALRPLAIRVYGNFAFAHYLLTEARVDGEGEVEMSTIAWTDILVKENGRWYWIGDHGHFVGDDDD